MDLGYHFFNFSIRAFGKVESSHRSLYFVCRWFFILCADGSLPYTYRHFLSSLCWSSILRRQPNLYFMIQPRWLLQNKNKKIKFDQMPLMGRPWLINDLSPARSM